MCRPNILFSDGLGFARDTIWYHRHGRCYTRKRFKPVVLGTASLQASGGLRTGKGRVALPEGSYFSEFVLPGNQRQSAPCPVDLSKGVDGLNDPSPSVIAFRLEVLASVVIHLDDEDGVSYIYLIHNKFICRLSHQLRFNASAIEMSVGS